MSIRPLVSPINAWPLGCLIYLQDELVLLSLPPVPLPNPLSPSHLAKNLLIANTSSFPPVPSAPYSAPKSHTRTRPSKPPVTTRRPSGPVSQHTLFIALAPSESLVHATGTSGSDDVKSHNSNAPDPSTVVNSDGRTGDQATSYTISSLIHSITGVTTLGSPLPPVEVACLVRQSRTLQSKLVESNKSSNSDVSPVPPPNPALCRSTFVTGAKCPWNRTVESVPAFAPALS